ncbi:SulP family inorganic anion transporter [Anaerobacillus sp. MEB173]|uniref:SulP family inorganic anion transporter n=1 Tax=Anaerobacillus sp. MEB173 TaxID=3383345 RepID=UPI003F93A533
MLGKGKRPSELYSFEKFRGDFSAGIVVMAMLIPQGIAYAFIAGVPPIIGLYAATIPLLIYALFGSSSHLAVGPVAVVSLIIYSGVSPLADPGSDRFLSLVIILTLLVGMIQLLLALFKMGFLVNILPHGVISGFTQAAALIIAISQLGSFFNVSLDKHGTAFHLLLDVIYHIPNIHLPSMVMGIVSIIMMISLKKYAPKLPAALVTIIIGTIVVYAFQLHQAGIAIIGDVPQGAPMFSFVSFQANELMQLLPVAITIALIGFMESIAIAKYIAEKEQYKINANKELMALGFANVSGSLFSSMAVAGGFSRTAVNYQAGAKTKLASIITALLMFCTLLFFTPLFYYMPKAVLAGIIIVAVSGLMDVKMVRHLFNEKKNEGWLLLVTFFATLLLGIQQGLFVGILFALLLFLLKIKWIWVQR